MKFYTEPEEGLMRKFGPKEKKAKAALEAAQKVYDAALDQVVKLWKTRFGKKDGPFVSLDGGMIQWYDMTEDEEEFMSKMNVPPGLFR